MFPVFRMAEKSSRKLSQWNESNMKEALRIRLDQQKGPLGKRTPIKQLSKDWHVPYTTLLDRIESGNYDNYKHAKHNSAHKNTSLNQWNEGDMKEALHIGLDQRKAEETVSIRQLSKDYDVPFTTLRARINSGDYDNYKHASGGKRRTVPKVDKGMFKVCW